MSQIAVETRVLRMMNRANRDYRLINEGDRILVCLSGGKDSYALMWGLLRMQAAAPFQFDLVAFHLDQGQPGYDPGPMVRHMQRLKEEHNIESELEHQDTYTRVVEITEEGKSYCSLCSRFRRAISYKAATRHDCNKVALGHHRDDLIETLLLNLFYSGQLKGMPPRLRSDADTHELIRPLAYVRETDLVSLSEYHQYEIMPCTLCGSLQSQRQFIKGLLDQLSQDNPHLKGNLLNAMRNIQPTQLMDPKLNPLYLDGADLPIPDFADDGDDTDLNMSEIKAKNSQPQAGQGLLNIL